MKKTCLLAYFFFTYVITRAQDSKTKQLIKPHYFLSVNKFKNNKPTSFSHRHNVYVRLRGQLIFPSDSLDYLVFKSLTVNDTIDLVIKSGRRVFMLNKMACWHLRDGANVAFGTISKLWKLKSIAEQDEYSSTYIDYAIWSTRYRIAPQGTTVNLPKISRLKSLSYTTCCSYNGQCIMTYQTTKR